MCVKKDRILFFMGTVKEILFDEENPIVESDYVVEEGTPANTILFCAMCELVFYQSPVHDEQSLLELIGAEQVATTHAYLREHTIYKALPIRLL